MQRPNSFLGGLSVEDFLKEYWQKKPLLCRSALPGYVPPLSADELAGLALEEEVESRIVKRKQWTLSRGPFKEETFSEAGDKDWTLLVQDLDQHVPAVSELLELLDFLPSWRVDDVMASFAAPGGSVGPHYDQYDVFLLQVEGTRCWQISQNFDPAALEPAELCILSDFTPEQQWELSPGDMLYLPPRVAHHGIAVTPCVTYSLGCRAPSLSEVIRHFTASQIDEFDESLRYQDPEPRPPLGKRDAHSVRPGQLSSETVSELQRLLRESLDPTPDRVARSFCQLVTEPKALFAPGDVEELPEAELHRVLCGSAFERRKGSRWLYSRLSTGFGLYVDGSEWLVSDELPGAQALLELLCSKRQLLASELSSLFEAGFGAELRALFAELVRRGEIEEARELQ